MAYELVYTSSPSGVRPGSSGFCVVACTQGLPVALGSQLEKLSAYKPYYPEYDGRASDNPVSCAHCQMVCGGQTYHILSRICHNGRDYTGRSNKLASHVALDRAEAGGYPAGPAALFLCPGLFREADWEIRPEVLPSPLALPSAAPSTGVASTWQAVAGDAGWAGVLAETILSGAGTPAYLVFEPSRPVPAVQLVHEALSLLPVDKRWQVTFNTYFTGLTAGTTCQWRFCPPDSEALRDARGRSGALVIDLAAPLPAASGGRLVDFARSGERDETPPRQPTVVSVPETSAPELKPLPPRRPMAGPARRGRCGAGGAVGADGTQPSVGIGPAPGRGLSGRLVLAIVAGAAVALAIALAAWRWLGG